MLSVSYSDIRTFISDLWSLPSRVRSLFCWLRNHWIMISDQLFLRKHGARIYKESPAHISTVSETENAAYISARASVDLWIDNKNEWDARLRMKGWRMIVERPGYAGRPIRAEFALPDSDDPEYENIPARRMHHLVQVTFVSMAGLPLQEWNELAKSDTKFRVWGPWAVLRRGPNGALGYIQAFKRIGDDVSEGLRMNVHL